MTRNIGDPLSFKADSKFQLKLKGRWKISLKASKRRVNIRHIAENYHEQVNGRYVDATPDILKASYSEKELINGSF